MPAISAIGGVHPAAAGVRYVLGRRGGMGYEEGELELEEGEAALGSADGYCNGGGGGGELVDPDALTYIVRDGSLPLFFFPRPPGLLADWMDGS